MTRKHFAAIAAALKASKPDAPEQVYMFQWRKTVRAVADACAAQNPVFRRSTFLDACGYDD